MTSVKWLKEIKAIDQPFDGFQQGYRYRYKQTNDEKGRRSPARGPTP